MDNSNKYINKVLDGRYRVDKLIGTGGMAFVYEALDLLSQRVVAVKILRDEISDDEASVKRFINESKAVAMLSHPNIVSIYDVSVKADLKYIVMEYIDGITLKSYMSRKGALPVREVITYTNQILRALEHAHSKGIIHRDIKPQNIMLLRNGQIKVMDFGIAKLPNAETVTMTDKAIGTVYYISPEQASGKKIDTRSDLYSMGVLIYEMSTGKLPFDADSPVSVALKQINEVPPSPRSLNQEIPIGLEQIILYALEKDPEKRFQTAGQMQNMLKKVKENPNIVFRQRQNAQRQSQKKKGDTMFPIILGVSLAFFVVLIISAVVLVNSIFFSGDSNNSEVITVSEFVGLEYTDELKEQLNSTYYRVSVEYVYNEDVPEGQIVEQEPKQGETRRVISGKQRADLLLSVSLGTQTQVMKDLRYYDYRRAEIVLRDAGFTVRRTEEYDDVVPLNNVIETIPAAGELVSTGSEVTIVISRGENYEKTSVPDFLGKTTKQAYSLMISSGLMLGEITHAPSDEFPQGYVIEQSLPSGAEVSKNVTKIDLVISSGAEATPVVTSADADEQTDEIDYAVETNAHGAGVLKDPSAN